MEYVLRCKDGSKFFGKIRGKLIGNLECGPAQPSLFIICPQSDMKYFAQDRQTGFQKKVHKLRHILPNRMFLDYCGSFSIILWRKMLKQAGLSKVTLKISSGISYEIELSLVI
jgi:hypothetical protein